MATKPKMKGLFKGFKYISQIFEEEKEGDIQIGFPTDVKHVAHIGFDGPTAVADNPSWMKEFNTSTGFQSAPLGPPTGDTKGDPEIKWVSEDSSTKRSNRASGGDLPDAPKSSTRHNSTESIPNDSSPKKKDSSTKPRSRRNHSKDSSEGSVKSNRQLQESSDSSPPNIPDPAKKSRRKKSRDLNGGSRGGEGSTRSRPKSSSDCGDGLDKDSVLKNSESQLDL